MKKVPLLAVFILCTMLSYRLCAGKRERLAQDDAPRATSPTVYDIESSEADPRAPCPSTNDPAAAGPSRMPTTDREKPTDTSDRRQSKRARKETHDDRPTPSTPKEQNGKNPQPLRYTLPVYPCVSQSGVVRAVKEHVYGKVLPPIGLRIKGALYGFIKTVYDDIFGVLSQGRQPAAEVHSMSYHQNLMLLREVVTQKSPPLGVRWLPHRTLKDVCLWWIIHQMTLDSTHEIADIYQSFIKKLIDQAIKNTAQAAERLFYEQFLLQSTGIILGSSHTVLHVFGGHKIESLSPQLLNHITEAAQKIWNLDSNKDFIEALSFDQLFSLRLGGEKKIYSMEPQIMSMLVGLHPFKEVRLFMEGSLRQLNASRALYSERFNAFLNALSSPVELLLEWEDEQPWFFDFTWEIFIPILAPYVSQGTITGLTLEGCTRLNGRQLSREQVQQALPGLTLFNGVHDTPPPK